MRVPTLMHDDETDIEAIYRRLAPTVYRRCLRVLGDRDQAADATQDVFIRVLRHRHRLPPRAEQLRWAYAVATRICLNRLRDGAWEIPTERVAPVTSAGSPDRVSERVLATELLQRHDESTRALVWRVLVAGETMEEAGDLIGLSRKAVSKRIARFVDRSRRRVAGGG